MAQENMAVSLRPELVEQANKLAGELNLSRSGLLALALEEFIQKHQSRALLDAINAQYEGSPDEGETRLRSRMAHKHRSLIEGSW